MSSNIYLTQNELYDLFQEGNQKHKQKQIHVPSFGDLQSNQASPAFQDANFFLFDSCQSSKKEELSTAHKSFQDQSLQSSEYVPDDSIKIGRSVYERLVRESQQFQLIQAQQDQNKLADEIAQLRQKLASQASQIKTLQSQIFLLRECNKKQQTHIFELLNQIKKLETENHKHQDSVLHQKLLIQDQLKLAQQFKIDSERLKIELLQKDEQLISVQEQLADVQREMERLRCTKSAQRNSCVSTTTLEHSPLVKSHYPSQPQINNNSFSSGIRTRHQIIRKNI